jgi:hypothetical protein
MSSFPVKERISEEDSPVLRMAHKLEILRKEAIGELGHKQRTFITRGREL